MMIDEQALKAAITAYLNVDRSGRVIDAGMIAAIEAYEAARWRPIEKAEREVGTADRVLICLTDTRDEIYDAFQMDDAPTWYFDTDEPFEIRHTDLVKRGALFRTIDPPQS